MSAKGNTTADCTYYYEPGATIAFSIGGLVLGETVGKDIITISDLLPSSTETFDPKLVNRARLLYSLTSAQGFETPITITEKIEIIVRKYSSRIDLDGVSGLEDALPRICEELNVFPKTVSHARNHLRREAAGFKVMRDMRIPTQGGRYLLGDVYLPLQPGKRFPVLISCTIYGRRVFYSGPGLSDKEDIAAFEKAEDDWHSTAAGTQIQIPRETWGRAWEAQRGFENIATFDTFTYVPHGYAMVKIDPKGVSQTPGTRGVPGEIVQDFYDAIEWAANQSWSNGNVAMVGSSYGANTQWNVASLKPQGLRCFVPYATDIDPYREATYTGGIPALRYISDWYGRVKKCSPKWGDHVDLVEMMKSRPFYDGLWEILTARLDQIEIPCFLAAAQIFIIHGRGAYEAWRVRSPENTHLQLTDCDYYPWPSRDASGKILQFLNHYLKGAEYPKPEKVGIQVRLGYGQWYWRKERNWPVPGTEYVRWQLSADGSLSKDGLPIDGPEKLFTYAVRVPQSGKSGASFISQPFENDAELIGHFKAVLSISSSMSDADVVVSLWPVNEDDIVPLSSKSKPEPLAKGFLRASHRKTDPSKTLFERPWYTHRQEDNMPLRQDEVAQMEIELFPAAGRIRKGWKLRMDVTPSEDQPDILGYSPPEMRVWMGENQDDETNTLHVGGKWINYVVCPVVPLRQGYLNLIL